MQFLKEPTVALLLILLNRGFHIISVKYPSHRIPSFLILTVSNKSVDIRLLFIESLHNS